MNLVEARGIGRRYGDVEALSPVDLTVSGGEWVAVIGPSGSGKSTLLAILGLLDTPSAGRLEVVGEAVTTLSERERSLLRSRTLGFLFQAALLLDERTATENLELGLDLAGVPRDRRADRIAEALATVDMGHRAHARAGTLSGGERQRVAFARALAHHPRVLLCDEPTGNLDRANTERIADLLAQAADRGIGVVTVTHDGWLAGRAHRRVSLS